MSEQGQRNDAMQGNQGGTRNSNQQHWTTEDTAQRDIVNTQSQQQIQSRNQSYPGYQAQSNSAQRPGPYEWPSGQSGQALREQSGFQQNNAYSQMQANQRQRVAGPYGREQTYAGSGNPGPRQPYPNSPYGPPSGQHQDVLTGPLIDDAERARLNVRHPSTRGYQNPADERGLPNYVVNVETSQDIRSSIHPNPWAQCPPAGYQVLRPVQQIPYPQNPTAFSGQRSAAAMPNSQQYRSQSGTPSPYGPNNGSAYIGPPYTTSASIPPGNSSRYNAQAVRSPDVPSHPNMSTASMTAQARQYSNAIVQPSSAPRTRPSSSVPYKPVSVLSSTPGYDPRVTATGERAQRRRHINQVTFGAITTPEACMVCKVPFGLPNPHGAYFENIRHIDGTNSRVEVNNFGAVESQVHLPCGHSVGEHCVIPYSFCPACRASLHYSECSHKVSQTILRATKKDENRKCVQCRVADLEYHENLSGLLVELVNAKAERERLSLSAADDRSVEQHRIASRIDDLQQRIDTIKASTDRIVQTEHYKGFDYAQ